MGFAVADVHPSGCDRMSHQTKFLIDQLREAVGWHGIQQLPLEALVIVESCLAAKQRCARSF